MKKYNKLYYQKNKEKRNRIKYKICIICKGKFIINSNSHKICSNKCRKERNKYGKEENINYKITCKYCKKIFRAKNSRKKYCSWKCAGLANRKGKYITCLICHKKVYVRYSWRKAKFCCRECWIKWKRKSHENNGNWKGGLPKCIDCGKKVSFNATRCRPCQSKYYIGKKAPRYGKLASHGNGDKYRGIYMRSNWEIAFAYFLDCSGIKWEYESKTFDLGNTTYTPDFYIPEWDCYIEIKGWWRDDAKEKFQLFKKKYSDINIKVLEQKKLKKFGVII